MFDFLNDWRAFAKKVIGDDGPEIRPMRPDDVDEVLRMIRLHDSDDYKAAKYAFSEEAFEQPHDIVAHIVLIDPDEERPVGVSGYFIDDAESQGVYWLGWTYVNPFFRKRGYGDKLMRCILEILKDMGARKLYLSTSALEKYQPARRFYEKYGFVQEGRLKDYYCDGDDKLILGMRLDTLSPDSIAGSHFKKRPSSSPNHKKPSPNKKGDSDDLDASDSEVFFDF